MARVYVGTSGWNYKHWRGEFYPKELGPQKWLEFFMEHFNTVEINNSFYRLPTEEVFANWRRQVPKDFMFAVKASRFLTHIKRLKEPEHPLELFYSRARHLRDHLGPVLFQLPPHFKLNLERLEIFLSALKRYKKVRPVLEVRDASWLVPPVFDLLRKHRTALCFADWRDIPVTGPVTADFVYVRRHYGQAGGGNYGKSALDRDVRQIRAWLRSDLDVYIYFNNDMGGHAIRNAKYVRKELAADYNRS
ncbi:MAG TPA: DUF72 domain-containing protein [Terriglobia bacterium]|nr:DUF72 domain-containing protein [Terriglobia bacterium]